ncbi:MAG: hypothetical protein V4519_04225 [Patescibacteria group bacterium]
MAKDDDAVIGTDDVDDAGDVVESEEIGSMPELDNDGEMEENNISSGPIAGQAPDNM